MNNIEYEISKMLVSPDDNANDIMNVTDWLFQTMVDTDSFMSYLLDEVYERVCRFGMDSLEFENEFKRIRKIKEDFKSH